MNRSCGTSLSPYSRSVRVAWVVDPCASVVPGKERDLRLEPACVARAKSSLPNRRLLVEAWRRAVVERDPIAADEREPLLIEPR